MSTLQQIAQWCSGTWLQRQPSTVDIESLCTDSRSIEQNEQCLFICLKTAVRNGHQYISQAYDKGVVAFLVSEEVEVSKFPKANFIWVPDTLRALQQIAGGHRQQFNIPIIGITGSNGKTIVKEWLNYILSVQYNTIRSPKSYNSQIGVPLSVWLLGKEHTLGIFEAGISMPNEMQQLANIIAPTIGVMTNIGEAHSEGFIDTQHKIQQKLLLFQSASLLIYCADQPLVRAAVMSLQAQRAAYNPLGLLGWSMNGEVADFSITQVLKGASHTQIIGNIGGVQHQFEIPYTDDASIENAIHCWCVAYALQLPEAVIRHQMVSLPPISMRLELVKGVNNCTLINDAYNNDYTSLQLALNYLLQQKRHKKYTLILSDMLQAGKANEQLYQDVAELLQRRCINRLIGIGASIGEQQGIFKSIEGLQSQFFTTTEQFIQQFHQLNFDNEAILLKGARVFAFERIGKLLQEQVHQTILTIDLGLLRHNLNTFRALLAPNTKLMVMVKAFAYGSGSDEVANVLQHAGVDYLTVAYTDEGIALRKSGIKLPIMVMSPEITSFERMIAWGIEPEIYNIRSLKAFLEAAEEAGTQQYAIHLKLDTGMHRLGFEAEHMTQLCGLLAGNSRVKVASIFSHLAASDDVLEDAFTQQQATQFDSMSATIISSLGYKPMQHLCNSSGIVRHAALHYDMVRLGLGLYGVESGYSLEDKIVHISKLKTTIAQIKHIEAGANIGYGHHFVAEKPMRIATLSIGYGDGYPRKMGNGRAYVLINEQPAYTVGNICMDMCMVDITDVSNVNEGDEVVVFGPGLPINQLATWAETIPYEIMTGISQRVKRVYINDN